MWSDLYVWEKLLFSALLCLVLGVVWLGVVLVKQEHDNPCIAYGPSHLTGFMLIGKVGVPQYSRDCLKREKDTPLGK